jgi:hypothetical protein
MLASTRHCQRGPSRQSHFLFLLMPYAPTSQRSSLLQSPHVSIPLLSPAASLAPLSTPHATAQIPARPQQAPPPDRHALCLATPCPTPPQLPLHRSSLVVSTACSANLGGQSLHDNGSSLTSAPLHATSNLLQPVSTRLPFLAFPLSLAEPGGNTPSTETLTIHSRPPHPR